MDWKTYDWIWTVRKRSVLRASKNAYTVSLASSCSDSVAAYLVHLEGLRIMTKYESQEKATRYWVSWHEPINECHDYRPNGQWPVPVEIRGYWCSGFNDSHFMMCALIDAHSEAMAVKAISKSWTDMGGLRFCEKKSHDWTPGDRFPFGNHHHGKSQ